MAPEHIVKSYDQELTNMVEMVMNMGKKVEKQLVDALKTIVDRDSTLAKKVIANDPKIDEIESEIDAYCTRLIALRQPVAGDLRKIIVTIKIASHLERIADYGRNAARRAISLNKASKVKPVKAIPRMMELVQHMIRLILNAYKNEDDSEAMEVWKKDAEVDEMYETLLRELLTYMMEDPRNIGPCTHLLFVAKNIERIGDHVSNIAEHIHYLVNGTPFVEPAHEVEEE